MSDKKCGECGHKGPEYERKKPEDRKEQILIAAIEVSKEKGYQLFTRGDVAKKAGVSVGLVAPVYFMDIATLRQAVMDASVEREIPEIIFQGLAVSDSTALLAPLKLRAAALALGL